MAAKRELKRKCAKVVYAQKQLCKRGARFWEHKGTVFNIIDLTRWQESDDDLWVLQPFVLLEELGTRYDCTGGSSDRQWLEIDAHGTGLSDASVAYFMPLRNLRELNISDTRITDKGFRQLQQALPQCKIVR